jgi:GNAT superfamily N-acetyltransferase
MANFELMSDEEIARYTFAHQAEAGCTQFDPSEFIQAVRQGTTVVERRHYGFAIVNPGEQRGIVFNPAHLWLIYVAPAHRLRGLGRQLLMEIVERYADGHPLSAIVHGANRSHFFENCGFRLTASDEAADWRRMEYR